MKECLNCHSEKLLKLKPHTIDGNEKHLIQFIACKSCGINFFKEYYLNSPHSSIYIIQNIKKE